VAAIWLCSLPPDAPPPRVPAVPRDRYREFQSVFDALSKSEKVAVERLVTVFGEADLALEMYIACDKNEAAAQELQAT
jgi:hypothetical protein